MPRRQFRSDFANECVRVSLLSSHVGSNLILNASLLPVTHVHRRSKFNTEVLSANAHVVIVHLSPAVHLPSDAMLGKDRRVSKGTTFR